MIVITVARKPLIGSVVDNIVQWGTGGLNIGQSQIGCFDPSLPGRWPSNVILDHRIVVELDRQAPKTKKIVRHMSYRRSGGVFIDGIPSQPEKGWYVTEDNHPSRYFKQVGSQ